MTIDIETISSNLVKADDGIWYSADDGNISYPADGNNACFVVEDSSFWFNHRNSCIVAAIRNYPPIHNRTIFDIGGGNGFVSSALEKAGFNVALIEPGESGALNAQKRGLTTIICATTDTAQIKNSSLPAIGLFDVIEHIEDDSRFLESMYSLLIEEGKLYATVPAYSFLWSDEDVDAGHYRRYTLDNITEKLQACGFEIEYSSYIFRMLPLPIFLVRRLPYLFGYRPKKQADKDASKSHVVKQGVVSRLLDNILAAETRNIARKQTMPFGGSCLIVAKKP